MLGYGEWMRNVRGLAQSTRQDRLSEALRFLSSLRRSGDENCLNAIPVSNIDAYVKSRSVSTRSRAPLKLATIDLRSFLRYLKVSGRIERDFSEAVVGPKCYKLEGVPFALQAKEVSRVLEAVPADHSPIGSRDYAILTLLATYGLRACEITRLRLEDIDWKNGVLRVRHAKASIFSELPLELEPGNAIVAYLRHGRPKTDVMRAS